MNLHIRDFIKDKNNCSAAFVEAVLSLSDGGTLLLDEEEYHFYPEGAYEKEKYVLRQLHQILPKMRNWKSNPTHGRPTSRKLALQVAENH